MNSIAPEPRLLDKLRHELQLKGYSPATEKNYSNALFHDGKTGPGGRWHINVSALKNAIQRAAKK